MNMSDGIWDAAVVGAGPAGAMTALELARLGKSVLLLERQRFPRWKVCGATINPRAADALERAGLGTLLETAGAKPLRALRIGGWGSQADVRLDGSWALSRAALDLGLTEAARDLGVEFVQGARARLGGVSTDFRSLQVTVDRRELEVRARVVIAADGLASGFLAQAGVPSQPNPRNKRPLIGFGASFHGPFPGRDEGIVHMAVGEDGYVGMVRVEDGSLNVAAALAAGAVRARGSGRPVVEGIVRQAGWRALPGEPDAKWQGTPELTRRPAALGADRILAVGDAGGYVEPFTGEGIAWALSGARALAPIAAQAAEGWQADSLPRWEMAHRRVVGRAQGVCRAVAWTLARPGISRAALGALRRHPRLASPFVRRVGSPDPSTP